MLQYITIMLWPYTLFIIFICLPKHLIIVTRVLWRVYVTIDGSFNEQLAQNCEKIIQASYYWSSVSEIYLGRRLPFIKGHLCGKCFALTPSTPVCRIYLWIFEKNSFVFSKTCLIGCYICRKGHRVWYVLIKLPAFLQVNSVAWYEMYGTFCTIPPPINQAIKW